MSETYYAWNDIRSNDVEVSVGEEVTAEKLGVSEERFQNLVQDGTVRTTMPPQAPSATTVKQDPNATYYAWSPIRYDTRRDESGAQILEHLEIPYGSKVTQESTKTTDVGWQQLIDSGAVSTIKPPKLPEGYGDSPMKFLTDRALRDAQSPVPTVE